MTRITREVAWLVAVFCSVLILAGCAVEHYNGGVRIRPDPDEILGITVGDFVTPSGKAILRQNRDGRYSIKVSNTMRVIDVGRYSNVGIVKSMVVGNEQVVILQTAEKSCQIGYAMYVFSPTRDYGVEKFGDCRTPMDFSSDGKKMYAYEVNTPSPRGWEYQDLRVRGPYALRATDPSAPEAPTPVRKDAARVRATAAPSVAGVSLQPGTIRVVQRHAEVIDIGASPGKVNVPQNSGRIIPRVKLD